MYLKFKLIGLLLTAMALLTSTGLAIVVVKR
mgnify:CR=1 FL=1|jgi:hypothetical protein